MPITIECTECKERVNIEDAKCEKGKPFVCKLCLPEGKKNDKGKLDWALLPLCPIREVIKVLMWGEKNYDRDNWQLVVDARMRYYNAAMRHITTWFEGKKNDSDTKLHHLAHAVCCLLFLIWLDKKGYKDADKKA